MRRVGHGSDRLLGLWIPRPVWSNLLSPKQVQADDLILVLRMNLSLCAIRSPIIFINSAVGRKL